MSFGEPVVTLLVCFLYSHMRLRASQWSGFDIRSPPSRKLISECQIQSSTANLYLLVAP